MATQSTAPWQAPRRDAFRTRSAADDAQRQLASVRRNGLHGVSCQTIDGKVVLSGTVRSFYLKQLAQEVLRKVEGIEAIDNRLEVT